MKLIDADKLILHLNDFALQESPDERCPDVVKEYTAKDMQTMIYRTIRDCISAVEEAPKVDVEVWEGYHKRTLQPKGTFEKIFNDPEEEDDGI
jgi:hypothetical protein